MKLELTLSPKTVIAALVLIMLVLGSIGLSLQLYRTRAGSESQVLGSLIRLFDVDNEVSIPTWYSSGLLLLSAGLLQLIARGDRTRSGDDERRYWLGLSVVFLYLSMDEASNIHELATPVFQRWLDTSGWLTFAWVVPAATLLMVFGTVFWRFWLRLPAGTRLRFAAACLVYLGGAVGMEMAGIGLTADGTVARTVARTAEELMEMLGIILFIYALLEHLASGVRSETVKRNSMRTRLVSATSSVDAG